MADAVSRLVQVPDVLLVDGVFPFPTDIPQHCVKHGDSYCYSIAAASILAKVTRDRIMCDFDRQYPQYNFARHKGYPTREHLQAIRTYGCCEIHRRTFRGVKEYLGE
jgi:ribonuclease HII